MSENVWVDGVTHPMTGEQMAGGVLENIHPLTACEGRVCVIHNPTDHHMRSWKTNWRADRGLIERVCEHDIGHPDPDSLAWFISIDQHWQAIHGCDGCCSEPTQS